VLDIKEVLAQDKYVGLLTYVGSSKKETFIANQDKIRKRFPGGMEELVSWEGLEVLINTVT